MPKLHELLATFEDQKGQATKTRTDLMATFSNKSHLFRKKIVTFRSNAENVAPVTESQSDIQTTLKKELDWVGTFIAKAVDVGFQIDVGNTLAKADLIVEDQGKELIIEDIPATALLQLEKHLVSVRELALTIPTLDPAQGFTRDEAAGPGIWVAREVLKERTKKVKKVLEVTKATDKHPATAQVYDADETVGTVQEQEWSSATTPAIKAEVINRCDLLIQTVKKARSRANSVDLDVATSKIGKKLLDFVFQPLA